MSFLSAVGQVLRECRLEAGLNLEACEPVINRDHLRKVELGSKELGLASFEGLCRFIGVQSAHVLLIAQARIDGTDADLARSESNRELRLLLSRGRFQELTAEARQRGLRGVRADQNREAVRRMQEAGHTKMETVRALGLARGTVNRYWIES